jgi:hypothetical protein
MATAALLVPLTTRVCRATAARRKRAFVDDGSSALWQQQAGTWSGVAESSGFNAGTFGFFLATTAEGRTGRGEGNTMEEVRFLFAKSVLPVLLLLHLLCAGARTRQLRESASVRWQSAPTARWKHRRTLRLWAGSAVHHIAWWIRPRNLSETGVGLSAP